MTRTLDKDMNRNPTGKGGFNERPEDRGRGFWKREDTPRFKLEQMMKLSLSELEEIIDDAARPLFEVKLATAIRDGAWTVIKEMTQEVYGKPKESVDMTSNGETIGKTVEVVWAKKKKSK